LTARNQSPSAAAITTFAAFAAVTLDSKPGNCPEWLFYCT
jgi:hypothetical protein